ncbi:hypothetical protein [Bacteroides graminisolvens]|uniref:hypothetical protein n=1 Tax=Bacteroides graminisolvens TaxID=477666 RepID=UPI0029C8B6FC|nr:hypothetical protein [Bacteroides graminisolvens]
MRDKSFYKEKAESIKNNVLEIQKRGAIFNIEDPFNSYPGITDIIREFVHLVFSFDRSLPLNKELENLSKLRFSSAITGGVDFAKKDFEKVISKIDFFIHYLDTYVD